MLTFVALELLVTSRILELGSGAGFLGITVAQMQVDLPEKQTPTPQVSLFLTDTNDQVLARCSHNVHLDCSELSKDRDCVPF